MPIKQHALEINGNIKGVASCGATPLVLIGMLNLLIIIRDFYEFFLGLQLCLQ